MLKKIFISVFTGMFFVAGANAAVDEREGLCVVSGSGIVTNYQEIGADYVIYFDNGNPESVGSEIPEECDNAVNDLVKKLKNKTTDIETVLLFGMADGSGNANLNARLGRDRMLTVEKLLNDAGVPVCTENTGRCAKISMGDAMDRAMGDKSSSKFERAVFMFVINKGDVCDESTIDALDALIKVLPSEQKLKDARKLCSEQDSLLLRSQRKQIMDAMLSAIQNYPEKTKNVELPADLSVSMLVNGVIAVRDSLAASASVWKKADGSFNTARLASDSIAGVVLGTAGGLITSNVVKKNQLSNGFENIMCTVGGQSVATYGDEFSVGIRAK